VERNVSDKVVRSFFMLAALGLLAGCSSSNFSMGSKKAAAEANPAQPIVVQGACPQVYLREGTAFYTLYEKGAKKTPDGQADPEKLRYEASLSDVTRQCTQTAGGLTMTVAAHGRLVTGPAGQSGASVTMPIRVAVSDGDKAVYSELTQYPAGLAAGQGSTQFIFTKADIVLPGGVTPLTKVYVGFDEGPQPKS
jgi:hypothetical protein